MMYGWSVVHCLPAAMAEQPSAALGTVLRESTVARLAAEAGFSSCEVVDVDAGFFRIYRLASCSSARITPRTIPRRNHVHPPPNPASTTPRLRRPRPRKPDPPPTRQGTSSSVAHGG